MVTVAVLEGHIERIVVSGNKQYTEANIRRSLPLLKEGQTPQVRKIDAQIQLANESAAKQVAVSLEPGQNQGEVNVSINVQEQPANRVTVAVDNTGNPTTGRWRTSVAWSNAALWDLDHSITLQYQTAPENPSRVKVYSANYGMPSTRWVRRWTCSPPIRTSTAAPASPPPARCSSAARAGCWARATPTT